MDALLSFFAERFMFEVDGVRIAGIAAALLASICATILTTCIEYLSFALLNRVQDEEGKLWKQTRARKHLQDLREKRWCRVHEDFTLRFKKHDAVMLETSLGSIDRLILFVGRAVWVQLPMYASAAAVDLLFFRTGVGLLGICIGALALEAFKIVSYGRLRRACQRHRHKLEALGELWKVEDEISDEPRSTPVAASRERYVTPAEE